MIYVLIGLFIVLRLVPSDVLRCPLVYIALMLRIAIKGLYAVSQWISYVIPDRRKYKENNPKNVWGI